MEKWWPWRWLACDVVILPSLIWLSVQLSLTPAAIGLPTKEAKQGKLSRQETYSKCVCLCLCVSSGSSSETLLDFDLSRASAGEKHIHYQSTGACTQTHSRARARAHTLMHTGVKLNETSSSSIPIEALRWYLCYKTVLFPS